MDYIAIKNTLIEKHKQELRQLDIDYVNSITKFKKGDIIRDHVKKIRIEGVRVGYSMDSPTPEPVYYGVVLNNNNTVKIKGGGQDSVWHSNIIS